MSVHEYTRDELNFYSTTPSTGLARSTLQSHQKYLNMPFAFVLFTRELLLSGLIGRSCSAFHAAHVPRDDVVPPTPKMRSLTFAAEAVFAQNLIK